MHTRMYVKACTRNLKNRNCFPHCLLAFDVSITVFPLITIQLVMMLFFSFVTTATLISSFHTPCANHCYNSGSFVTCLYCGYCLLLLLQLLVALNAIAVELCKFQERQYFTIFRLFYLDFTTNGWKNVTTCLLLKHIVVLPCLRSSSAVAAAVALLLFLSSSCVFKLGYDVCSLCAKKRRI